jgi:hypothetical protein
MLYVRLRVVLKWEMEQKRILEYKRRPTVRA